MLWERSGFLLTDDPSRLDLERSYSLLNATYWGVRRPREVVERMIEHSLCFCLLREGIQVGFARAVTDYTVFSWIADLVIDPPHRGLSLGKWMMECIISHPVLERTQMVLQTRDAHALYEQDGFRQNPALMSTPVIGL